MRRHFVSAVAVAVASVCLLSGASATVLLSDDFSGSGALAGHAPQVVQHAGDTWSDANGGFSLGAAGAAVSAMSLPNGPIMANVPFTPSAGTVYTLSANITADAGWLGIGFQTAAVAGPTWDLNSLAPWIYGTGGDSWGHSMAFLYGADGAQAIYESYGMAHGGKYELRLDTTNAIWTVSAYVDGVQQGTTRTYASNPDIRYIALARTGAYGTIANLQVTDAVLPEPASLAVVGSALLGLSSLRRCRHQGAK